MDEHVAFPALPQEVRAARRWARDLSPVPVADTVELIVSELVTNAVAHGSWGADRDGAPPEVALRMTARGGRLRITVTNPGGAVLAPRVAGHWEEHGRGLAIALALADAIGDNSTRDRTEAWAEITIPGAPYVDEQHPAEPTPGHQLTSPPAPCPGYGRTHRVESVSGPGGMATQCIACAPPARPAEEAPPCTADTSPRSTTARTAGPTTSATTPAASSPSSPTRSPLASRGPST